MFLLLNDRREDIPLLANHFIEVVCNDHGVATKSFGKGAIEALQNLDWTGNIREFRNVIERLVILCSSEITKLTLSFTKKIRYVSIDIICISFFSSGEYPNKEIDLSLLVNTWTHSREENKLEIPGETYRPSDYKTFPPARYRQIYKFNADYTCSYLFLSPTDGHQHPDKRSSSHRRDNNCVKKQYYFVNYSFTTPIAQNFFIRWSILFWDSCGFSLSKCFKISVFTLA